MDISVVQLSDLFCCLVDFEYYFCEFILFGGCEIIFLLSGKIGVGKFYLINVLIGQEFVEEGEEFDL